MLKHIPGGHPFVPGRRVLIVEDEFFVALDLELLVHKQAPAAQVVVCASVAEARLAAAQEVELALLDVDVLDGKTFEVARILRERGTPVVFISASEPERLPPELADLPFIPKPYAPPQVQSAIRSVLAGGARA